MTDDLLALIQALPPEERARLLAQLGPGDAPARDRSGAPPGDGAGRAARKGVEGDISLSNDARINGVAVGVNLGAIIYGRDPSEDERRRLVWYLSALANDLWRLPLRGLDPTLAEGPGVELSRVYVMLATTRPTRLAAGRLSELRSYFADDALRPAQKFDPDFALPPRAILRTSVGDRAVSGGGGLPRAGAPDDPVVDIARAQIVTEALCGNTRLVLLGDPGSGKSTFLRHLAWALARRGLDQAGPDTELFGWEAERQLLPVILPLRRLAGALALAAPDAHARTVHQALCDVVAGYGVQAPDNLLTDALVRGAAIILLDGLDEVPIEATETSASRLATLRAARAFAERYAKTSFVLTCRSRAFTDELRACLDWPVETLAPFTLGQVRHFVPAWYGELKDRGQLTAAQAERLSAELIAAIAAAPRLRSMAETPLLLTLMALLLFRRGALPRDRPRLYEEILELLLGQWDKVRDGQSLAEVIGRPDWTSERLRPLLDRLSYEAHLAGSSLDGRGRLERGRVRNALIDFFKAAQASEQWAWGAAQRCLEYFEQRSGLLVPDGAESYVFAHLTLQEHCAGRHMLLSREAVGQVLARRAEDRWREPIFLGLGVVQATNPYLVEKVLRTLIDRRENEKEKPAARWYRDLILAAELGKDRDWSYLREQEVDVASLQADLRAGLAALLADRDQPLPARERVSAGFLLGELGDPRVPITPQAWRREVRRAMDGDTTGYFCRVEAGTYWIGSGDDDPEAADVEKPRHQVTVDEPFYIARYPITNAQWQAWGRLFSKYANHSDLNGPNQPVVGLQWAWCNQFCAWLTEQLHGALPPGHVIRLPTEAEWEAAARGGDTRRYPWGDDWRADHAATAEDRAGRGWKWSVPVGCYPAGAAPCGALDMAGNVWEWTASVWQSYPKANNVFTDKQRRALRGGSYGERRTDVRCGARGWYRVVVRGDVSYGFRVVLAPRSHTCSDF